MKRPRAKTKKRTAKAVGATKPARQKSKNKAAMVSPTMTVPPAANEHELAVWRSRLLAILRMLMLIKGEQEKWLEQEPVMLEQFFGLNEMDALRKRINGMLVFLSDRDLSQMYFLPTGEQVAEHRVRRRLWMNSRTALQIGRAHV